MSLKTNRKKLKYAGFTLVEMLIVLLVIAVLIFLFVPSLMNQRERINKQESAAFEQVVENQLELYQLNERVALPAEFEVLRTSGYLTAEQAKKASDKWTNIAGFSERNNKKE